MPIDRAPILAGKFYPEDETALDERVSALLGVAQQSEPALGLIVPHGSLEVSGPVAAAAYARVRVPDVVVILASSHTGQTSRGSILAHGLFRIPGARVPVDTRFAEDFRGLGLLHEDEAPHVLEHAIEAQLPFLVRRNPRLRIVPVVFGPMPHPSCVRIGNALADCINNHGRDVLVVATTTLSHYVDAKTAEALDGRTLDRILSLDGPGLFELVADRPEAMCSAVPVAVLLACARALGRNQATLVRRGSSGEATGSDDEVAGFASVLVP